MTLCDYMKIYTIIIAIAMIWHSSIKHISNVLIVLFLYNFKFFP